MRKSINSLAAIVERSFRLDLFSSALYAFCNVFCRAEFPGTPHGDFRTCRCSFLGISACVKYQNRDDWMLAPAVKVVAIYDGVPEGTRNTIESAKTCGGDAMPT